jgi:predicted metalloprotease with PDZ domain
MPKELRFCRNCGFRLGEGSAEYTETVRFQNSPGKAPWNTAHGMPFGAAGGAVAVSPGGKVSKRRRRMSGMSWMFIALFIFFIAAAGFTAIIKPIQRNIQVSMGRSAMAPRSYAGVHSFDTTEGGVTFDNVEPPGSPADQAGLVGGDIITTFDGQKVETDDQMMELLGRTPIGKTVDVVYVRDGEVKNTKLTTISKAEFDHLSREFRDRPEGIGQFGFDDDEVERVEVPGVKPNTKIFGVQLNTILQSRPADLAGVKAGDIVTELDGIPIRTPEEFLARVRRAIPYSTIQLKVIRNGERIEIPVKMGKQ